MSNATNRTAARALLWAAPVMKSRTNLPRDWRRQRKRGFLRRFSRRAASENFNAALLGPSLPEEGYTVILNRADALSPRHSNLSAPWRGVFMYHNPLPLPVARGCLLAAVGHPRHC